MAYTGEVFNVERRADLAVVRPLRDETTLRYFEIHNESNRIMRMLDDPAIRGVVVNFCDVPALGWVMTSAIVRLVRNVDYRGGGAAFCNASPTLLALFETMHLGRPWTHHELLEEAIEQLTGGPDQEPGA